MAPRFKFEQFEVIIAEQTTRRNGGRYKSNDFFGLKHVQNILRNVQKTSHLVICETLAQTNTVTLMWAPD